MYYHSRKAKQQYRKHHVADKSVSCTFCEKLTPEQSLAETEHNRIIRNRTQYATWEHYKVLEHLLVVPKRHVTKLNELTEVEQLDLMRICAQYEADGYSVYARAVGSPRRSVQHQHTHLIRIAPEVAKAKVYMSRPYINISVR